MGTAAHTEMNVSSFGQRSQTEIGTPPSDPVASRAAALATEQTHYAALARMVGEVSQDHAQLRMFVYEYVRIKLRKELYPLFLDGGWAEIEQQAQALEAAIDQIEKDFAQHAAPLQYTVQLPFPQSEEVAHNLPPAPSNTFKTSTFGDEAIDSRSLFVRSSYGGSAVPVVAANDRTSSAAFGRHLRSSFWRNTQLILAATIGFAIFVAIDAQSVVDRLRISLPSRSPQINATDQVENQRAVGRERDGSTTNPDDAVRLVVADVPLPSEYGAYAVLNGKLTELGLLPIKVPDPRVAISAPITVPSQAHLPSGQFQLVVFRRDLKDNAPDRVSVRVVAQVVRALTFDSKGHAKTTGVEQAWVIRNHLYQMRVAPLGTNPEMIVIRSDPADFVFPAGRYALVLKGVGYDFTVDGEVRDLAHCLERTDALSAPVYSECRKL
jgi:hypothetical protein